jgi:hypothetical protein
MLSNSKVDTDIHGQCGARCFLGIHSRLHFPRSFSSATPHALHRKLVLQRPRLRVADLQEQRVAAAWALSRPRAGAQCARQSHASQGPVPNVGELPNPLLTHKGTHKRIAAGK